MGLQECESRIRNLTIHLLLSKLRTLEGCGIITGTRAHHKFLRKEMYDDVCGQARSLSCLNFAEIFAGFIVGEFHELPVEMNVRTRDVRGPLVWTNYTIVQQKEHYTLHLQSLHYSSIFQ